MTHELAHTMQRQERVIWRFPAEGEQNPDLLESPGPSSPSAAPNPANDSFPEGWRTGDFLTTAGRELWETLDSAWAWLAADRVYAVGRLQWLSDSWIPGMERWTAAQPGDPELLLELRKLAVAIDAVLAATVAIEGDIAPLASSYAVAAEQAHKVDMHLPESAMTDSDDLTAADPLIGVYHRTFPDQPIPAELDGPLRTRLAFALAGETATQAVEASALQAMQSREFWLSLYLVTAAYVALLLAPDVTVTKIVDAGLTAYLLTMFALSDIYGFARSWWKFHADCRDATTEAQLREAGATFVRELGRVGFDLLVLLGCWRVSEAISPLLRARATVIRAERQKAAPVESDGNETGSDIPVSQTARPQLSVAKIRQLITESNRDDVPVLAWRTRNLDVVSNQVIQPMAQTNPGMRMPEHEVQTISLWRVGFTFVGFPGYGDYVLLVRSVDLLSAAPRGGAAEEWRTPANIPVEVGGWATIADVNAALGL